MLDNSGDRAALEAEVAKLWDWLRAQGLPRTAEADVGRRPPTPSTPGPTGRHTPRVASHGSCPISRSSPRSSPSGDQPHGHHRAGRRACTRGDRYQTLQGITGLGQDGDHRLDDRAGPAPDPHHRAQQVAGRPALLRAAGPLPQEPGRVLRLLLRLLPARGLPAHDRHLHREGLVHQRRDRPAAPRHHLVAPHAPRRHRRGLGVVHLRPGLARRVPRPHPRPRAWGSRSTSATCCAGSSTCSTPATTSTWCAAPSGPAATRSRSTRPTRSRRSGSRCSATPSSASCPSTS